MAAHIKIKNIFRLIFLSDPFTTKLSARVVETAHEILVSLKFNCTASLKHTQASPEKSS